MNVLIWGAGRYGRYYLEYIVNHPEEGVHPLAFVDNSPEKIGTMIEFESGSIPIIAPREITKIEWDFILIANKTTGICRQIRKQIEDIFKDSGTSVREVKTLIEEKSLLINVFSYINRYSEKNDPRVRWLREYATYANDKGLEGSVAECGVFRGEFAFYINKYFSQKKLYLFDTFDGFYDEDIEYERSRGNDAFLNGMFNEPDSFRITDEEIVKRRMPFITQCIIKKGYFPDTTHGINDTFCFVNLDMDLYKPMLAALRFFYSRMTKGGVILCHDFFQESLPGVKEAVTQFEEDLGMELNRTVIGDECSIAIIK